MKLKTGFEGKKTRIDMIPLIDIVFLLLVFFIYAMLSMTIQRGLKVNVPQSVTGSVNQDEYISITINAEGDIFLNKERVTLAELPGKIKILRASNPDQKIFINGDKKTELGIAIETLDTLRSNGIEEINFVTTKAEGTH